MFSRILRTWASLQRSQWFKKNRLTTIQDAKVRRIVNHAYHNVPFYNKLYHRMDVDRVKHVSDLSTLPPITRRDLQGETLDARTAARTDLTACMLRTTSGTTACPVQVLEDALSVAYRDALNLRLLWAYGARPFDKLCRMRISDPTGTKPKARLSDVGLWGFLRAHGMKQLLYDSDPATVVAILSDWEPSIIFGMGSYLRLLSEYAEQLSLPLHCKTAITSGEILDGSTRSSLRTRFHADIYDHYGMEEVGGSIAWECPTHSGYHINDECVILEFLRDGEPVAPGEPGEIHVTSLTRTVTPIIRYATGDVATPLCFKCQCGRGLSLLKDIQGRILDFIITKDGRYVSPASIISRLQDVRGLDQFKVVQNQNASIDIRVRIAAGLEIPTRVKLEQICTELFSDTPVRIIHVAKIDYALGRKFRIVESSLTNRWPESQVA